MSGTSKEAEQLFHLVFPGNILPGADRDEVALDLSLLLKTPPDSVTKLISGKRRYVKRTFPLEQAKQLQAQVVQLGVECEIEPVGEVKKTSTNRKRKKRKEAFPDPEDLSSELDLESDGATSYSETMAQLQKLADGIDQDDNEIGKYDFSSSLDDAAGQKEQENDQEKVKEGVVKAAVKRRLALFVADNFDDYLPKFDKFQQGGQSHFVFTWHWPAFFVPFFWAVYRKLWGWSFIIFISSIFWPLTNILWAATANFLYFRHSERKIKNIRKKYATDEIDEQLSESGGTSSTAMAAAILVMLLLMTGVYWSDKLSPVFTTLNDNLERIEQSK